MRQGGAKGTERHSNTVAPEYQGRAAGSRGLGGAGGSAIRGGAGVRTNEKPSGAKGDEDQKSMVKPWWQWTKTEQEDCGSLVETKRPWWSHRLGGM